MSVVHPLTLCRFLRTQDGKEALRLTDAVANFRDSRPGIPKGLMLNNVVLDGDELEAEAFKRGAIAGINWERGRRKAQVGSITLSTVGLDEINVLDVKE